MKHENINLAETEARRFLKKVSEYKANREKKKFDVECKGGKFYEPWQDKYRAAIVRASLDLTRILAKMRNE